MAAAHGRLVTDHQAVSLLVAAAFPAAVLQAVDKRCGSMHNKMQSRATTTRFKAVLLGRCPRCRCGRIYRTLFRMNETCPVCHLQFRREQGYFLGALYVYYGLSLPIFLGMVALLSYWKAWSEYLIVFPALLLYAPFIPFTYRTARILWIHFDRFFDPE